MSPSVTVRLLATQSDARLVDLARQGHERAFEALVQRHRRPLLAYCRRALLPDARAEDALQQALLQAWLALQRGDEVRDARAWLYRIVRNTALNALRGSGYDYAELSEALSGAGAPHEDLDRRIAVREALAGLAALPQQQREALLRTAVEGASHADAAAEMGVSEGALRGLVHRARVTLRAGLTAITPMPLASWAAGAAGHGTVAELAAGGGSAGLAGLVAKGGAVAVTAGVLAVGAGTVEQARHVRGGAPVRSHVARADAPAPSLAAATPVAATTPSAQQHASRPRLRRRDPILAPAERERAPVATVRMRDGGRGEDGGGEPPRHDMTGGDHDGRRDGGDGSGSGGSDRPPDSQPAPAPAPSGGGSGDDGGDRGGTSGSSGSGGDDGSSGSGGGDASSSGTDGGSSDGGSDSGSDSGSGSGSGSDSGSGGGDYINGSASPR